MLHGRDTRPKRAEGHKNVVPRAALGAAPLTAPLSSAAVDSVTFPDETISPPPRESRLATVVRESGRSALMLALLIGYASIFSAVIAWQASLASIDASRYQSLAVQQQARREQIERELEAIVDQDRRFVAQFQEHALAARALQSQADALRASDPDAADLLDLDAHSRLAMARAMQPFFMGASGIALDESGIVPYDSAYVLRNLSEGDAELRELRTSNSAQLADRADEKTVELVAVGALVVASLFFLTIAQVSRTRQRLRSFFFATGGLLVLAGTLMFVFVEIVA